MTPDDRQKAILIVILILSLLLVLYFTNKNVEGFATKREKADNIISWFGGTDKKTYTDYKNTFGSKSNIVEYEDALKLYNNKNLTASTLTPIL